MADVTHTMRDKLTTAQRAARLYRGLRGGNCLTARQIATLVGYKRVDSVHRFMLLLEREDPDLVRAATLDLITDRPVTIWRLRVSREYHG